MILGSIVAWRACFPHARCANLCFSDTMPGLWHIPAVDADFVHFEGLWELDMGTCKVVTDAALMQLRSIRKLYMTICNQITSA